jgi:AcrR family transcriptional regulator
MDTQLTTKTLTAKGEQTREHLLDIALQLFMSKGYEATTMRDIAGAAGCSLGLAYRYFDHKEELVLALYRRLAQTLEVQVQALPPAPLVERFRQAVALKLALIAPYREPLGALFGAALTPHSEIAVLGSRTAQVRQQVGRAFLTVVIGATDPPRQPQAAQLALVLYAVHLGLLLYWLHDRSAEQEATQELLAFTCDTLSLIRPLLRLPPVTRVLTRLVKILQPMVGASG